MRSAEDACEQVTELKSAQVISSTSFIGALLGGREEERPWERGIAKRGKMCASQLQNPYQRQARQSSEHNRKILVNTNAKGGKM